MRANLFALLLGSVLATGAFAVTDPNDPYVWLEEVHGEKQLAWVKEQNAKSLGPLKADPRYQKNYDSILEVLDATDRIPMGSLRHGFVYNFWQDADQSQGRVAAHLHRGLSKSRAALGDAAGCRRAGQVGEARTGSSRAPNVRPARRAA